LDFRIIEILGNTYNAAVRYQSCDIVIQRNCIYNTILFLFTGNCYAKIKEETTRLQDKIVEALGLNPVDKEVVVLYKGEKEHASEEFSEVS
jgi:hypothetical protein